MLQVRTNASQAGFLFVHTFSVLMVELIRLDTLFMLYDFSRLRERKDVYAYSFHRCFLPNVFAVTIWNKGKCLDVFLYFYFFPPTFCPAKCPARLMCV